MLEPSIEVSRAKSSSTILSSYYGASDLRPINIMPLQAIPMETIPYVDPL